MRSWILGIFLVVLTCAIPAITNAQNVASITGIVTDSSGAVVPGASIKIVNTKTDASYSGQTAGDGSYRIVDVPPGPDYSLTVTKDSFIAFTISNLYLPVGVTTTQDVKLELGSVQQSVVVTATGSVTLNTTDTSIGNNFDTHAISSLPNEFRDNPANLLRLEVGVISAIAPSGAPTSGTGSIDPNLTRDGAVAGARTDQGNIIVDGIDASNISSGFAFQTTARIPVDAIQEFNTLVANPTPEYGGRSGSQTLITTKSGSNDWHGSAYEYNRTAATEANSFFNQRSGTPRTALIRNQFGGNVGGPAWKNKAFFFFEYDGRRDNESASSLQIVPMPHVKLGELAYINNSGDGANPNPCLTARLTAADVSTSCITILPAAQVAALDPCSTANCSGTPGFVSPGVAPALTSLFNSRYPNPNDLSVGDGINSAGFRFNVPNPLKENDYLGRADFNLNSQNKLFARFNFTNITAVNPDLPNQFPGDPLTAPDLNKDRGWALGESWIISPNLVNKFTYGESRENHAQPILFNPSGPLFELSFDDGLATPFVRQTSFETIAPEPTFRDDVTWVHGNHTFSFGGVWNPILIKDGITNDLTFIQQGLSSSQSLDASLRPADISSDNTAASKWDSAFVGNLGSIFNLQAAINYTGKGVALPQGSPVAHDYRITQLAGYFNDAWKIRPSVTLSLGVRYQYSSVPYETHGVQASFLNTSFKSLVQTRIQNGLAGISGPDATPELTYSLTGKANHAPPLYNPEYHDFSPRIGVAWNPSANSGFLGKFLGDRKTVIRAGGSLIYDDTVVNNIIALQNQGDYTFGGSFAENFITSGASNADNLINEPRFDSINSSPVPVIAPPFVTPITPSAIFNYDVNNHLNTPYSIITSFGIQRELPAGLQLEADYYGRFGRRLFVLSDAAQLIDFTDPASGQTLVQAITVMEKAAMAGAATVAPQPFFEDIAGAGSTASTYSSNLTSLAFGNTAGVAFGGVLLPTNVGFTPQFLVNALGTNQGNSSYNALFTSLRKRLSNNLQFDFDYTFSHSIDNNSTVPHANGNFEPGVTTILCDATNPKVCRGNSEFDATHQVTAYFVYDLPVGHGQRFASGVNKWVNEAIGGWQISGVETWRTGLAFTADSGIASTTSLAADAGEIFVGPKSALSTSVHIDKANNDAVQLFKNPAAAIAAFTPDLGMQVGTRDNLRGPHFSNTDLAVTKNFPIVGERYLLQFRAEAYNAFNHTNFGLPDPTLTSPSTFGTLSTQAGTEPSRVMQFALRFDF